MIDTVSILEVVPPFVVNVTAPLPPWTVTGEFDLVVTSGEAGLLNVTGTVTVESITGSAGIETAVGTFAVQTVTGRVGGSS